MNISLPSSCKSAKLLGSKHYFTGKPCKRGHIDFRYVTGGCAECAREDMRSDYKKDPQKAMNATVRYREKERERTNAIQRAYYARHHDKIRAEQAEHRARRMYRVPLWSEREAIKEFYKNCPEGYEVDHIYPLQGETVSGLHVLNNLQYLTRSQNRAKRNRV